MSVPSSPSLGKRRAEPYPTNNNVRPPRSTRPMRGPPGLNIKRKRLVIHLMSCSGVPPVLTGPWTARTYYVVFKAKLTFGSPVKIKSSRAEIHGSTGVIFWDEKLYLEHMRTTDVTIQIIAPHTIGKSIVAEMTEKAVNLHSMLEMNIPLSSGEGYCTLHMTTSEGNDAWEEVDDVMGRLPSPAQIAAGPIPSQADGAASGGDIVQSTVVNVWKNLLDKIDDVADAVEALSQIHPYAQIAWSVIGAAYKLAKNQQELDDKIASLVESMQITYSVVTASKALSRMRPQQEAALIALMKQTTECGYFIIEYMRKTFWTRAFHGLLSNVNKVIDDYCARFAELRTAFSDHSTVATQVLVQLVLDRTEALEATVELVDMPFTRTARWRSDWANLSEDSSSRVLLLTGFAGTGKSSVAHSVARYLHDLSRLGASYCFERSDTTNHRPDLLFPTLSRDLADCHPLFKRKLARIARSATLRSTPDIDDQFENLILKPLSELAYVGPLVIVIDALDESASPKDRRKLLWLLSKRLDELPGNIRFILTSRPEDDIMATLGTARYVSHLSMSDIHPSSTISDIASFISSRLVGIDGQPLRLFAPEHHRHLARKSEGLFQWAAVVCETIMHGNEMDYYLSDEDMLSQYARFSALSTDPMSSGVLDELYRDILLRIFPSSLTLNRRDESIYLQAFRQLLGHVLAVGEPLSANSLFQLLHFSEHEKRIAMTMLRRLGALLTGVHDMNTPIRLLHSSFRDFLCDPSASEAYYIDPDALHPIFVLNCFKTLNRELHFNLCGLESSYALNEHVGDLQARLEANVSAPLSYAAQHWGSHLAATSLMSDHFLDSVTFFLRNSFLFWLELLSLLGAVHVALPALNALRNKNVPPDLEELITDYIRFVRVFSHPIMSSAPHVYVSAYAMTPSAALVRRQRYSLGLHHLARISGPWDDWPSTDLVIDTPDTILSISVSPDGRWIASSSVAGKVYVWSAETGRLVGEPLAGHTAAVASVAFSSDGYRIASGSHDTTLRIWNIHRLDLGASSEGIPLMGHSSRVNAVAFAPGDQRIASGSDDMTVRVWHTESSTCVLPPFRGHAGGITSVAFSPGGQWIASASLDETICIWDVSSGMLWRQLINGHNGPVTSLVFSPDGHVIVSGSLDASLGVWDAQTGQFRNRLDHGHTRGVTAVAYSLDGNRIVSSSQDQLLCVWDMTRPEIPITRFNGHTGDVRSVAFSPDGHHIVSGADDKTIRVWRAETKLGVDVVFEDKGSSVSSVAISSDAKWMVNRNRDQIARVQSVTDDATTGTGMILQDQAGEIGCVSLSPNGHWIAIGSEDRNVHVWDLQTGWHECTLEGHTDVISSVAFLPDGRRLVSASHDASLRIWDVGKQALAFPPLEGYTDKIMSMALSPDGRMIVSGSADGLVCIWDAQRGRLMRTLIGEHPAPIQTVVFAPNGRLIASGSWDCSVCVWNAQTGQALWRSNFGHTDVVTSLAFSLDGRSIISGSKDCMIHIWNAYDGTLMDTVLIGHTGTVSTVAVSQPAMRSVPERIVSASNDRTVRIWSLASHTYDTHRAFLFSPEPLHAMHDYPCLAPALHSSMGSSLMPQSVKFTLTYDWWIMDVGHKPPRALLWIPPEMRDALYMPNTMRIIGDRAYGLDLSDFAHGARWIGCWQEPAQRY